MVLARAGRTASQFVDGEVGVSRSILDTMNRRGLTSRHRRAGIGGEARQTGGKYHIARSMQAIWTIVTTVFGTLAVMVIGENVKVFLRRKGWDTWLTRIEDKLPTFVRYAVTRWQPLRQRWWLWLALGFTGGVSLSLWIFSDLTAHPPASVPREDRSASQSSSPGPSRQEPITWGQVLLQGGGGSLIGGISIYGETVSPIEIADAYIVSDLTGEKRSLVVVMSHGQDTEFVSIDKINTLPAGAPIELRARFSPGLSVGDFLSQWGKLAVKIVYNDGGYSKSIDEGYMRQQITMLIPGAELGPRVTKKAGDQ
jgi:hypothetical protein